MSEHIAGRAFVQQSSKWPSHEAAYAAALEAAALVCDERASRYRKEYYLHKGNELLQRFIGGEEVGADDCAEAIRELIGKQP